MRKVLETRGVYVNVRLIYSARIRALYIRALLGQPPLSPRFIVGHLCSRASIAPFYLTTALCRTCRNLFGGV